MGRFGVGGTSIFRGLVWGCWSSPPAGGLPTDHLVWLLWVVEEPGDFWGSEDKEIRLCSWQASHSPLGLLCEVAFCVSWASEIVRDQLYDILLNFYIEALFSHHQNKPPPVADGNKYGEPQSDISGRERDRDWNRETERLENIALNGMSLANPTLQSSGKPMGERKQKQWKNQSRWTTPRKQHPLNYPVKSNINSHTLKQQVLGWLLSTRSSAYTL